MDTLSRRDFLAAGAMAAAAGAAFQAACCRAYQKQVMPPIHGWQYASASEAARAIRAGEISSAELTKLMLDRIRELNPRINAIVTLTADAALHRA